MNVPDAAIEAAAEALAEHFPTRFNFRTLVARAAIDAAMPAIREAIAQEIEAKHRYPNRPISELHAYWDGINTALAIVRGGAS